MRSFLLPFLLGSIVLYSLTGCNKENAVPQPALVPAPDPVTELSIARTTLIVGTWRTLAKGPDLNKNQKLDSNETDLQLGTYLEFIDYKYDGSGLFRIINRDNNDSLFQTSAFQWYLSNNGENMIVVSDNDTTIVTILSLNKNTFNWSRKTVSTQWFGFCSRQE